jgi:hypothetical protein
MYLKSLALLFGILLVVFPTAYLKSLFGVEVLIVKSPGGLNEVGFLIFEIVRVNKTSEEILVPAGNVISIINALLKLQIKLLLIIGDVIPQE